MAKRSTLTKIFLEYLPPATALQLAHRIKSVLMVDGDDASAIEKRFDLTSNELLKAKEDFDKFLR